MTNDERKKRVAQLLRETQANMSAQRGHVIRSGDFARWLGISGSSLSQYTAGNQVPTGENFVKLADRLGQPFFDAMGLSVNMPQDAMIRYVIGNWDHVDSPTKTRIVELIEERAGNPYPAMT